MDKADPAYKGQAGYNAAMLAIYDVWVLRFMSKAVWKVPVELGVDRYRQHMGHRHLDVGPGPVTSSRRRTRLATRRSRSWTPIGPCFVTRRSDSRNGIRSPSRPTS